MSSARSAFVPAFCTHTEFLASMCHQPVLFLSLPFCTHTEFLLHAEFCCKHVSSARAVYVPALPKACALCLRRATSGSTLRAVCSAIDVQFVPLAWLSSIWSPRVLPQDSSCRATFSGSAKKEKKRRRRKDMQRGVEREREGEAHKPESSTSSAGNKCNFSEEILKPQALPSRSQALDHYKNHLDPRPRSHTQMPTSRTESSALAPRSCPRSTTCRIQTCNQTLELSPTLLALDQAPKPLALICQGFKI